MGLIQKSTLVTLNQRVQGSSPCAHTTVKSLKIKDNLPLYLMCR
jgi:hypothetical protein